MSGELPQSNALAEASPESLAELLSRDPEGYQQQDLARIVAWLREQRERWAKTEAEAKANPKPKGRSVSVKSLVGAQTTEELGL